MSNQLNLLAQVRQYLISNNEEYQWITMDQDAQRIGLAYLPINETGVPSTFMFTELEDPASLVFDAHFALRVVTEERQELSMLLITLNANLPEGQLLLDMQAGLVYFQMKYSPHKTETSSDEIQREIARMESVGVSTSLIYARIISDEFTTC